METYNIIYNFINNKKVNGTLFYCFEYFIESNNHKNTDFLIYDISKEDLLYIKQIFLDKYTFDITLLNRIKIIEKRTHLITKFTKYTKTLFLDVRSFNTLHQFIKNKDNTILCFNNTKNPHKYSSKRNSFIFYGSYDYQTYDKYCLLKLNFNIFKKLDVVEGYKDTAFLSIPFLPTDNKIQYQKYIDKMNITEQNVLTKNNNIHNKNLFNTFYAFYYFHIDLDTNNRIIPECFYYNKKITIEFNGNKNDSIYLRYNDILKNGLSNYNLELKNDIMLMDLLFK